MEKQKNKPSKKNPNIVIPNFVSKHLLPSTSPAINDQEFNTRILSQFFDYKPDISALILTTTSPSLLKRIRPQKANPPKSLDYDFNNEENSTFDEKVYIFKELIKKIKINWMEGHDSITIVNRDDIISESMKQFCKINVYKELKINFEGEVNQDAGGLIREWISMLFKRLESPEEELFEMAPTSEITYKLHRDIKDNSENVEKLNFMGKIIGKALLESLTFNTCFNKVIFKIILDEEITLADMVDIDKDYYNSLTKMKEMSDEELALFTFMSTNAKGEEVPLIVKGDSIEVNKNNIDFFIQQKIKFYIDKDRLLINEIKKGLLSIIPFNLLKIFKAEELALLINGVPFIDVVDWRNYTEYTGYDKNDEIIINFWNILNEYDQEQLKRLLQFCTGSKGVPIGGFKLLISNRDKLSPFTITKVEYDPKRENFIKAHTCFNRLDLPCFPTKELLAKAIGFIAHNDILGFGID